MQYFSQFSNIYNNSYESLQIITDIIDAKNKYSKGHSLRVAKYAREIGRRYGYDNEKLTMIYNGSLLHDIGKIAIPDYILNKKDKLTNREFSIIKSHTLIGSHILSKINEMPCLAAIARSHHEHFDGKGYPDGLTGNNIPEFARIVAIADAYDAMTSNRSYRNALPQKYVRFEIVNGKSKQFDPTFVEIILKMIDEDKEFKMREMPCNIPNSYDNIDFSSSFLMSLCPELALSFNTTDQDIEGPSITFSQLVDFGKCMPGGFFVYKAQGNEDLLYANDIVFKIFGCKDIDEFKELTGFTFHGMVYSDDLERTELSIIEQIEKNDHQLDYVEYRIIRKDGKIRWIDDYGRLISTPEYGDVFCVLIRDITDKHISREMLTDIDHVTNIFNRRCFDIDLHQHITNIINNGGILCMIMIDIDKFKNFNDLYGHLVGDKCLAKAAQEMQNALRRKSDKVFRYGGEEFAVLLPGTLIEDAVKLAERIRLAVRNLKIPHEQGPYNIVTVSCGVGMLSGKEAKSLENPYAELIKLADQALYRAKDFGRDNVKYQKI